MLSRFFIGGCRRVNRCMPAALCRKTSSAALRFFVPGLKARIDAEIIGAVINKSSIVLAPAVVTANLHPTAPCSSVVVGSSGLGSPSRAGSPQKKMRGLRRPGEPTARFHPATSCDHWRRSTPSFNSTAWLRTAVTQREQTIRTYHHAYH